MAEVGQIVRAQLSEQKMVEKHGITNLATQYSLRLMEFVLESRVA